MPKNDEDKENLLKKSIKQIDIPAFLCKITPENPNFLEIIDANDDFLKDFDLGTTEILGNNYDFLMQGNDGSDYGSSSYFEYVNLIKAVKSLQIQDVNVSISNPKTKEVHQFKVRFVPSRYKTKNIYCTFSFTKLDQIVGNRYDVKDSISLINNLRRAVKNERLLRQVSSLIASEENLKIVAGDVVKIICDYLKVDRCILYDCVSSKSGFFIEYCAEGVKKISDSGDPNDLKSPIGRYVDFQNNTFLEINHLKKTTTMMVSESVKGDPKFKYIDDVCQEFNIGSQIVVIMAIKGKIIGALYIQDSLKRSWLLEESELIDTISSQFSIAIDKRSYNYRLIASNRKLVTQSRKLKEMLIHEKKMRELQSEFVALVSHEFKTPLQIIDASRELILRKAKSSEFLDDTIEKSLVRIGGSINRMNNLIQSNLDLSKMEISQGGIKVDLADFEIKKLIIEIIDKNSNLAKEKSVKINVDMSALPEIYRGDRKLLDHSFTNIITNAIKYSRPETEVSITSLLETDNLLLKISDSGIGIPEDEVEKVGKKFFRAKNTLSVAGTGIGLYLTKSFVKLHGGFVSIESKLNVGTSITISLPNKQ
ncbi:MAG: signal transduction histidine kinase [Lentimonas sp.]|jgi:signal transduction histidine kinase